MKRKPVYFVSHPADEDLVACIAPAERGTVVIAELDRVRDVIKCSHSVTLGDGGDGTSLLLTLVHLGFLSPEDASAAIVLVRQGDSAYELSSGTLEALSMLFAVQRAASELEEEYDA